MPSRYIGLFQLLIIPARNFSMILNASTVSLDGKLFPSLSVIFSHWSAASVVSIIGLLLCSIPYAPVCWLGVTILTGWLVITTVPQTSMHRGALILLATTFPMLWSRVIFRFLSEPILLADAWIVAKLLNTANEGTHIQFVDKSGVLEVSPACSSWANVSLVLLTWIVLCQYQKRAWQLLDLGWCALVVLTVVGINTIRMAMMGIIIF